MKLNKCVKHAKQKKKKKKPGDTSINPPREIYDKQVISSHKTVYKTKARDECWPVLLRKLWTI